MADAGDNANKGTKLLDSLAALDYNRFEDTAIRVTDARLQAGPGKHPNMAPGLGYGVHHADHYLYLSYRGGKGSPSGSRATSAEKKRKQKKRQPSADPNDPDAVWDQWRQKQITSLNGPQLDLTAKRTFPTDAEICQRAGSRQGPARVVDHRFMGSNERRRAKGAQGMGYGFRHWGYTNYIAARRPIDIQEALEGTNTSWDSYQKLLADRNILNMDLC